MPFETIDGIEFYTFDNLNDYNIPHGVFTRKGGVSPQPWASLNLGGTVGDTRENVIENRRRIFAVIGNPIESIFDVWQVHSTDVICTNAPRPLDQPHQKGDAILTTNSSITVFMRFADCVPVLLYDPVRRVVGMVHAGWLGTVKKVAAHTVAKMQQIYGSDPADVLGCIGPSIGAHNYQVGDEVIAQARQSFGAGASKLLSNINGKIHLDLWVANAILLEEAGVKSIEVAGICTCCDPERWYSHRGEHGKTGRFGALISL